MTKVEIKVERDTLKCAFWKVCESSDNRVITLGCLYLDSKARLPTDIHSLLLEFSFKWFWKHQSISVERQLDVFFKTGEGCGRKLP